MTHFDDAWGTPPSKDYERLAAQFRPIFKRIREGAVERETNRILPYEQIGWLKEARIGALRVPREHGGFGCTLPELFNILIELSEADSNITQALRGHFALVEDIMNTKIAGRRETWLPRFAKGEISGNAYTELNSTLGVFSTTVTRSGDGWRLAGTKFYTTGSIFADWIHVGCATETGAPVSAIVHRNAPGVAIIDDWDGFGQTLTGSGTSTFTDAHVALDDVADEEDRFKYSPAFYQMVHLANLAGIGRAAAKDAAASVSARKRTYSHASAGRSSEDAQVLQIVGRVRGAAYAAGALVSKAAEAVQTAFEARTADIAIEEAAVAIAEIEVAQAQTVISNLVLDATALVFDALGASAVRRGAGLDRYWRNARTLSSHNPRIYKDRIVGDYAVNGVLPPPQWSVGQG